MEQTLTFYNKRKTTINGVALYHVTYILLSLFFSLVWQKASIFVATIIFGILTFFLFRKKRWVFSKLAAALLISSFVMFLTYYAFLQLYGSPYLIGGSDDFHFEEVAEIYIKNGWYDFTASHGYSTNDRLYVFIIQCLMVFCNKFGGYHTIVPRLLNVFITIAILGKVLIYVKEELKYSSPQIKKVFLLYVLNIYYFYVANMISRDILCIFFVIETLVLMTNLLKKRKILVNLILIALILFLSYFLRSQLLPILLLFIFMIVCFSIPKKSKAFYAILIAVFLAIALLLVLKNGFFDYVLGYMSSYTDYQADRGGLSGTIISMPLFPLGAILRIGLALIYPFPSFTSLSFFGNGFLMSSITFLGYIYEFFVFIWIPRLIIHFKENKAITVYYLYFLLLFCLMSFTFRHFIFTVPFYAIIMGKIKKTRKDAISGNVMIFLYVMLQFAYMIVF